MALLLLLLLPLLLSLPSVPSAACSVLAFTAPSAGISRASPRPLLLPRAANTIPRVHDDGLVAASVVGLSARRRRGPIDDNGTVDEGRFRRYDGREGRGDGDDYGRRRRGDSRNYGDDYAGRYDGGEDPSDRLFDPFAARDDYDDEGRDDDLGYGGRREQGRDWKRRREEKADGDEPRRRRRRRDDGWEGWARYDQERGTGGNRDEWDAVAWSGTSSSSSSPTAASLDARKMPSGSTEDDAEGEGWTMRQSDHPDRDDSDDEEQYESKKDENDSVNGGDSDVDQRQGRRQEGRRRRRYGEYVTYFKDEFVPMKKKRSKMKRGEYRGRGGNEDFTSILDDIETGRGRADPYDDDAYDSYDDDYYEDEDDYYEDEPQQPPQWEWETTRSGGASVLLPPAPSEPTASPPLPRTILHFIGGTVFGSYPTQFYSPLLTAIAKRTNSIVIATAVPVTLDRNPLDHLGLTDRIVRSFREAYYEVVCDEYGGTRDAVKDVPIVGLGHSLGAKLHVVMGTDARLSRGALPRAGNVLIGFCNYGAVQSVPGVKTLRRGVRDVDRTRREAASSAAASSSSGRNGKGGDWYYGEYDDNGGDDYVATFEERSRSGRRRRGSYDNDDEHDTYEKSDNREGVGSRRRVRRSDYDTYEEYARDRRRSRNRSRHSHDHYYDDDIDDDDDLMEEVDEFFSLVSDSIQSRLNQVKTALTPADLRSNSLEFRPSPDELWSAITATAGEKSYGARVEKTLVVQFERDDIDQGARLARCLVESSSSSASVSSRDLGDDDDENSDEEGDGYEDNVQAGKDGAKLGGGGGSPPLGIDVKFARLGGTHLTPVSYGDGLGLTRAIAGLSRSSLSFDAVLREVIGEEQRGRKSRTRTEDGRRKEEREMEDLVSSIVRYIEDVIICSREK